MSKFETDMNWTCGLFTQSVWPNVRLLCGGGDIITMEINVDRLADNFDKYAGVDLWQITQNGMRGLASRIQRVKDGAKPYNSFTIREKRFSGSKTEYVKRKEAIKSNRGFLYPHLFVHAYVRESDNKLLSAGVCKTVDLFKYIDAGHAGRNITTNASFYTCFWADMKNKGYDVKTYVDNGLQLFQ